MFSIFKSKPKQLFKDFSFIGVDIHSHLLPGVDDGAKDTKDSLAIISALQELGFNKILSSPHVMAGHYPNTSTHLKETGAALKKSLNSAGIDIPFGHGAEYYLDEYFENLIDQDDLLTLQEKYLLFELSFVAPPPQLEETIFKLKIKRYKPILAHPERYTYWSKKFTRYERLKEMGCLFQLNLLSIIGGYGPEVEKNAKKMLKAGLFDLAGTDAHNLQHVEKLKHALSKGLFSTLNNYPFKNKDFFYNKK